ncbi:MAG: molybdate ABC transporter permease subunit [Pseudomonadales bacterium]|jgi:molybdate transport system permease protein|nr:molybdate ABC transporter permease subunit [Pseudomonadales bacterium]MDP5058173.1 molybdate ABC transporter permease subunit [Pseudomonadales bacterium]
MLPDPDSQALWLTLQLALTTTGLLMLVGTPLAWWLARTKSLGRVILEPIVALPVVLPPTVLGFYLLLAMAPNGVLGQWWFSITGERLAFTFNALVIGSIFYSLPFYVQPLQVAFENIQQGLLDAAATLGAGPADRFFSVVVPLSRRGFVTAICLAFAHTVGEFGIVLMIGGNIPGETRVLSIALFDHVESLQYEAAHRLALGLLIFSFALLALVYGLNRHWQMRLAARH